MSTKFTFEAQIICRTVIEAENYDEARSKYDNLSNADVIEGNDEREVVDWWTPEDVERRRQFRLAETAAIIAEDIDRSLTAKA